MSKEEKGLERRLRQTINKYMREMGFHLYLIKGEVRRQSSMGDVPAFGIGVGRVGRITVSDKLPSIVGDGGEVDFVIAHEICHIVRGHSVVKGAHYLLKRIYLVWAPWTVFRRFLSLKPIETFLVRGEELSADSCAVGLTQNKEAAISAIRKLCKFSGGNLDTPSHGMIIREFLSGSVESTPTETFRERIDNIETLQL